MIFCNFVVSFSLIFLIILHPLFFLVIFAKGLSIFYLESILSDVSIAASAVLWFSFVWNLFPFPHLKSINLARLI